MSLFSKSQIDNINAIAQKSKSVQAPATTKKVSSINDELYQSSKAVEEYFKDSPAVLIETKQQLHDYVTAAIEHQYVGIDTETTGLDRQNDYIVGASLYYPNGVECYIPMKHRIPIFEDLYKGQLSYGDVAEEFQRLIDGKVKLIFANANFDLYMIWKDLKVDLCPGFYYDVILAWRCLKEDELHNGLKELYNKYVLKGEGDPKRFSDFFSPALFPYCKPEVAKLYAANDAKITYDLFRWQLPFTNSNSKICQKYHLESISELIWKVEFPLVPLIQEIERTGMYLDLDMAKVLQQKYHDIYNKEMKILQEMVQEVIDNSDIITNKQPPFTSGFSFNPKSTLHVKYLLYTLLNLPKPSGKESTGKEVLAEFNLPITSKIAEVRSLATNINTFVDKLPEVVGTDGKIHADFRQVGASTGRMCIAKGTKISILNGYKNIEDIKPGDLVYCYDKFGELQLAPVKNLWMTSHSSECVDITWQSSGSGDIGHLICTPEHRILLKSGEWIRADQLKRYDKVVHMRRTVSPNSENRPQIYGWNGLTTREQDVVKRSIFKADSKSIIHHKDGDPSNNSLDNLEIMTIEDHVSLHSRLNHASGQLRYGHLHTKECQEKATQIKHERYVAKVRESKQELLDLIKTYNGRISYIPVDFDTFKYRCEVAGIDLVEECRKYNPRYYKQPIERDEFISVYNKFEGLAARITEYFGIGYDKFYKYCDEFSISTNHMIQSIRPCGNYEVYDIEVEGNHNFIANEICVHNSSASPNLQNIPSKLDDIRQMFRAEPAKYIDEALQIYDSYFEIKLPKFYQVKLSDGRYVAIDKLEQNQQIIINHKDDTYCVEVLNIDICETEAVLKLEKPEVIS